ncbi:hypothetical protein COEREDRAFT_83748 [Coemansia reversa NRRL 1564]|uniref:Transcription factor TFIIIC triple barrel domain-containing protein n=1 Tax=Coemansia reversa (strain ATCC 12441 / NRRL 1564) TaxID=763665 RepID=A0A2G5B231_COERN|nr:hypothetical protein COEREDRAFT_83748 [Coemansia reversa NRRL 1564]|eukprot:PIA13072.1 hypothetical protein COEREDRAFT_83748 [Coemansia reversa NRRL 1564]
MEDNTPVHNRKVDTGSLSTARHAQMLQAGSSLGEDANIEHGAAVQGGDDDEIASEYDEEEYYVVATLPAATIKQSRKDPRITNEPHYALIDMDTERPFLEIDGTIFQGTKDELLGTAMLFDTVVKDDESDEVDMRLVAVTSKVVSFNQVKLSKRTVG